MCPGSIAGFTLILALFTGTLGQLHERQQPPAQPPANRAWLSGLKPHQVTALCIVTPGQPAIRVRCDGRNWTLASKDGYPASRETIRQLLCSLADAHLLEEKSTSSENRKHVGLSDQGKGQASWITLERGDTPSLALLLGERTSQDEQLVRWTDDKRAQLTDRTVGLPVDDPALLDPRLADLSLEQLCELTLPHGNGIRLNISRVSEKDDGIRLRQFPSRPQLIGEVEAGQAICLLAASRLLEVAPAKVSRQKPLLAFALKNFADDMLQGQLLELERQYWLQLTGSKGSADEQVSTIRGWCYRMEGLSPDTAPAPQLPKTSPVRKSKPAKLLSSKC